MVQINKKLVKYNFVKGRGNQKIKYIVWHDTGNPNLGANADAHYRFFNSGYKGMSAHYFVDEIQALQIIEDSDTAWHVGDGNGKYGITNSNSIGIELCIDDGDYTKEIDVAIDLTIHLMKKYNIPIENVIRHYDASRKLCPRILSANNWQGWTRVKEEIKKRLTKSIVKVNRFGKFIEVEGKLIDGYNYIMLRDYEEKQGNKVDWDNNTQTVLVK